MGLDELRSQIDEVRTQRDEEIEAVLDGWSEQISSLCDDASDLEDFLIDYRFDAVEECLDGAVKVLRSVDLTEVRELVALRLPGDTEHEQAEWATNIDDLFLRADQLPPLAPFITDISDDEYLEAVRESLIARVSAVRTHLCDSLRVVADRFWPAIRAAARQPAPTVTEHVLATIADELVAGQQLWLQCAVELYEEFPGELGEAGDIGAAFGTWLVTNSATRKSDAPAG